MSAPLRYSIARMDRLLEGWQPGYTLPQGFYARSDVFQRDRTLLLNHWIYAAHISEIPSAGDYVLAVMGRDSAIILHGADGQVRALANVCRHRGSRLCVKRSGQVPVLTCPYHAWSYHLDGSLRHAREMPEDFDPAQYALDVLSCTIVGGLIFVCFGDNPADMAPAAAAVETMTAPYGWAQAKIAARKSYTVQANWKLVLENYHECYHCAPSHPEFAQTHVLARPGMRRIGAADYESWDAASVGREPFRVMHSALAEHAETGSQDGTRLAPAMGDATLNGSCVFAELGLLSAFLAYPDHGVIYRFDPVNVRQTAMEVLWLVHGDADEGAEYDAARLTWLWDVTSQADKRIIEGNQQGVLAHAYRPGPFSKMEPGARQFVERYVAEWIAAEREGVLF